MVRRCRFTLVLFVVIVLTLCFPFYGISAAPSGEPIVIGYVGMVLSPGTRPCLAIQKVACQEINEAGGVLGRPLKYVIADNKGSTSLSVEGARRLLVENQATFISVEGRTEICLAVQENNATMFKDYPHILIFNGATGIELTERVFDNYEKFRFCFRPWDPEPVHYSWLDGIVGREMKGAMGAKKMAVLWEDLAWTDLMRAGIDYLNLPGWEEVFEKRYGMKVVYSKPVKPRGTMYLPLLQQMAGKKPDVIFYISSWFTDTESFVKQWADSAVRDVPVSLYGGVAQTSDFWQLTGGKALGVVSSYFEGDIPYTDKTLPFIAKAKRHQIPLQLHVHLAYADIYHMKAAIERAGGVDDIDKLIKAFSEVKTTYSLGIEEIETRMIRPYIHCRKTCDPYDPFTMLKGQFMLPIGQYHHNGEIKFIAATTEEDVYKGYVDPKNYIPPAQLRESRK